MQHRVALAGVIVLAGLAVLGKSAVMLVSVLGMGAAYGATRQRPLAQTLGAVALAGLSSSLAAEVVHTLYHAWVPGSGGPGDSGGFFASATLVGLINVAAFGGLLLLAEWAATRRTG